MRLSSIAAFSAGAIIALGAAYIVETSQDSDLGPDEVREIVAAYLADNPNGVTPEDVGRISAEHLAENPDVVVEAIRAYQQREEQAEQTARLEMVQSSWAEIARTGDDPVLGNPDGDVTLVEFFDYRCGYCRRAYPDVHALQENDPNLRIVLKEFPILGPESVFAARASLAAREQNLAPAFHAAAMEAEGNLTEARVLEIAEQVGLDVDQLRQDMEDPEIEQIIQRNFALAERLGIRGTPAFLTKNEIIPGAVGRDRLETAIAEARKKES